MTRPAHPRDHTRVLIILTALAALGSCTTSPGASPDGTVAATSRSAVTGPPTSPSGSSIAPPTISPITPSATLDVPSIVPAAPPWPQAVSTDFHDPVAVARAWMTQWCATDWREPRNGNVDRATVFSTTAGKTADIAAGDTEAGYRKVIEHKLANRCDQVTAEINPAAPRTPDHVYVVLTARRTLLADGRPVQAEPVSTTRAVLRQPDGRWLVDVHVEAG